MLTLKKLHELCQHLNNRQCSIHEKVLTVAKYRRYVEDSMRYKCIELEYYRTNMYVCLKISVQKF